jgi:hypothetical protein
VTGPRHPDVKTMARKKKINIPRKGKTHSARSIISRVIFNNNYPKGFGSGSA